MDGMSWFDGVYDSLGEWLEVAIMAGAYAGLLAMVVLAINLLFRRWLSAAQMGLLWGLVLLRLVIPIVPASSFSLESLLPRSEEGRVETRAMAIPLADSAIVVKKPTPYYAAQSMDSRLPETALPATSESHWLELLLEQVCSALPLIWFAAGTAGLAYTVVHYVRFCRRVEQSAAGGDERMVRLWKQCCELAGVRRIGRVLEFDGVDQPAVMRVLRPTLLLPADAAELDDEQLQMVMLHELAHVRRWDIAGNWALVLIRAVHWWNPVYWLAASRFRSLREQACDAFVVRTLEVGSVHGYGELLLALAQRRSTSGAWRVMLPASILSFSPSLFRRRAVRVRLSALRQAGDVYGRWHAALVAALLLVVAASGFTVAKNEEVDKPVDLPTWMASHPDAVLTPKRSFVVEETYEGPRETRRYDVAKVIDNLVDEAGSKDKARWLLEVTLKQFFFHHRVDNDGTIKGRTSPDDLANLGDAAKTAVDRSLLMCKVEGTTLVATAPAMLHEQLARALDAWRENGLAQITIETRFLNSNRELVSELGVSWQFLEAFSPERETVFPSAKQGDGPVVHAESRVDEYLPLVVATLNEEQTTRLIESAQGDRRSNVLQAPKVTMFNGMEATIADCTQRPFVVGVFQRMAGATEPKVVVLEEGTKIKVRAVVDGRNVRLQASLDMKALGEVATATTLYRGSQVSIQVPSVNRRSIDVDAKLESGQTLLVGSIPTGKQQKYSYYLVSAKKLDIK